MKRKVGLSVIFLSVVLLISGCTLRTVDQMYCLPKRTADYQNLQKAIDAAMVGLEYCAPRSGENQQTVQTADLNGDDKDEYLVFAKGNGDKPLHILVFGQDGDAYQLMGTISSQGAAFEQVEYVQMDDRPGVELIVGCQVSDQVLRALSVYSFANEDLHQLMSANYSKFVAADLNEDGKVDLMVIGPGTTDVDNGVATLYSIKDGSAERSAEVSLSMPVDHVKRIMIGKLYGGVSAAYVASSVEESAIITDVLAMRNDRFTNISFSNDHGTSVQTLRNYYIYADDLDNDGILELPSLIHMMPLAVTRNDSERHLIRWYNMALDGSVVDRMYTYHNFDEGWYLQLDRAWAPRTTISKEANVYQFYVWDEAFEKSEKIFSIYAFTGTNRDAQAQEDNRFVLFKSNGVVYAAKLEASSVVYDISQESLINCFRPIQLDWKTGET